MNKVDARTIFEANYRKKLAENMLSTDYVENTSTIKEMSKEDFVKMSNEINNATNSIFDTTKLNNNTNQENLSNNFWGMIDAYGAEDIFTKMDADGDGILSEEEIKKLSNLDGDAENMSIYDLQNIIEEMDTMITNPIVETPTNKSNGGSGGGNYNPSYTGGDKKTNLKTAEDYQKEITNKENEKTKIKNETDLAISAEEAKIQEALAGENSGISEESLREYTTKTQQLDLEITAKDEEIASQKTVIQDSTAEIEAQTTSISKLETQISNLKASLNPDENADNSEIEGKIANLEAALADAKAKKEEAENNKSDAETAIATLEQEKTSLQQEKEQLKDNLINNNKGTLSLETQQIITNAKNEIKRLELEEQNSLSKIDGEIQTLKTELVGLQTEKETSKVISENSTFPTTEEQLAEYGFDTKEKREAFEKLTPEMKEAVIKLTDFAKSEGIEITYNSRISIFRTYEDQVKIYNESRAGYAAKPGNSRHESGEAVDITIPGANKNDKNDPQYKKLAQFWQDMGYTWGGNWKACEPWHFDLRKA